MRILLTGRDGQVGHELRRTLARLGTIIAPDRAVLDLAQPRRVVEAVRQFRPELIINAAAWTAVDLAERHPEQAAAVNAAAPEILAVEASRIGARLIHYSTDYVFDGCSDRPYRPDDPTAPLNVYGRTKLAGERAVLESDAEALVIRTSWVYSTRRRNFLTTMLNRAVAGAALRVVDDEFGSPTPARLVAEVTAEIIAAEWDRTGGGDGGGLLHLACDGVTSWYGFARAIFETTGLDPEVEPIEAAAWGAPAPRPRYSALDTAGLRTRYGLELPDWRTALQRVLGEDRPLDSMAPARPREERS